MNGRIKCVINIILKEWATPDGMTYFLQNLVHFKEKTNTLWCDFRCPTVYLQFVEFKKFHILNKDLSLKIIT